MTLPEREAVPGIGPRRAEIIVAGAQVFAELLESFSLPGFRYSPLGLRDGILAQMLAAQDDRAAAHRQFEIERWEIVVATAKRYGVDLQPGRAGARARGAAVSRTEIAASASARVRETGWPPRQCCATRANSSTTRGTIGTPSTLCRCRRCTAIRRCSAPLSRPSRATWARAVRSRTTARCATFPPDEHKHVERAVVLLRLAVALNQDRASDVLRRGGAGISQARVSGAAARHGQARNWSCGRCGKRPTTSARSLSASSSRHWRRSSGPCADR